VERTVALCLERFGRINVLDNNVGIVQVGGVVELSEEDWDRVFAVNLKSCYLAMKYVIPVMERRAEARSSTSRRSPRSASWVFRVRPTMRRRPQ
jgi:NAD(P)-dependent dehydrogenase (short-subunit alcohol dehydrogenase family)